MVTVARGRWKIENEGFNNQENEIISYWTYQQQEQYGNEKPLSAYPDCRYDDAGITGMESAAQENKAEHKKYIFKVIREFPKPSDNG